MVNTFFSDKQRDYMSIISCLIALFMLILYVIMGEDGKFDNYNEDVKSGYNGKVIKKYIDENNHSATYVIFKNDSLIPIHSEYYENIEIGDSISKEKNSRLFRIYKPTKILSYDIKDQYPIFDEQ